MSTEKSRRFLERQKLRRCESPNLILSSSLTRKHCRLLAQLGETLKQILLAGEASPGGDSPSRTMPTRAWLCLPYQRKAAIRVPGHRDHNNSQEYDKQTRLPR